MNLFLILRWYVENGLPSQKIRFGLGSIKNFGNEIGKANYSMNAKNHGPIHLSIEDFLKRVLHKNLTKKSMEALIMCGAFDTFGDRGMMLANMEQLLTFNKSIHEESNKGI
jgi:DNA polymerase-3 subunit alpha